MTIVVLGDALLDRDVDGAAERLCPDAPVPVVEAAVSRSRPGGAALAAALAASDGRDVVLITALASDGAGRALRGLLDDAGVDVVDVGCAGATAEKVRILAGGRPVARVDLGGRVTSAIGPLPPAGRAALGSAAAVLVADYGRGVAGAADIRGALSRLGSRPPVVWDPHPRGAVPVPGARLVTPNRAEAARFAPDVDAGTELAVVTARGRALLTRWSATAVAVTMGERGALLVAGDGPPLVVPAPAVLTGDPCGAGDRFASAAAGLLADGAVLSEAVLGAVDAASTFVATGGASGFPTSGAPPRSVDGTTAMRATSGTIVATGGCFDVLHTGHVATLEGARALGDRLVVLLNSDASVRRLKGPGRPVVPEDDRVAMLHALACVDDVVVFDEDTPEAALARLRPQVFVKGGDYAVADLPEAALLASWGGQAVVLPYREGRSTTGLLREVVQRGLG